MRKIILSCLLAALSASIVRAGEVQVVRQPGSVELDNGMVALKATSGDNGGLELSYWLDGKRCHAATIAPAADGKPFQTECSMDGDSRLLVQFTGLESGNGRLGVRLFKDSAYVEFSDSTNIPKLAVKFDSQALVLPDQLAEDIVIHPEGAPGATLHLPSDSLLALNMLNDGEAILSCIWQNGSFAIDEVQDSASNRFHALVVKPPEGGDFWLGVNAGAGIWHRVGETLDPTTPVKIAWTPPFPARWQATMRKETGPNEAEDGLCDSWPVIEKIPNPPTCIKPGMYLNNPATWSAWSSFWGGFVYPCSFAPEGCMMQYPSFRNHPRNVYDASAPVLIYPLQKSKGTPANVLLPLDALEFFAGSDVARKLKTFTNPDDRYPATCGVTEEIEKIFYRGEQETRKDKIRERLNLMNVFVVNVRKRISQYLDWETKLLAELDARVKNNPDLAGFVGPHAGRLNAMPSRYAEAADKMQQPEDCAAMAEKMAQLAEPGGDEEQEEEESKQLGRQIRTIGGNQDTTLGAMRYHVKCLRQRATLDGMSCGLPQEQVVCALIRRETADILGPKCGMEGK
jgi:hypothetical protein